MIGRQLGPYKVLAKLGEGGMGEVYRATDTTLKRQVAIKVLPGSLAGDADRLARFQREAEILAALNHPHIAQVFGFEKVDGASALVMELVEGPTLLTAVPLQIVGNTLKPGLPVTVSRTRYFAGVSAVGVAALRGYDVAPDGQRFLMIKEGTPAEREGGPASLVVRLIFAEVLNARLSSK